MRNKEYTEETLDRLLTIRKLKSFGFTLNEAAELLDMVEMNTATCDKLSQKVAEKVVLVERKIKELEELKVCMTSRVSECLASGALRNSEENCPVISSSI